MRNRSTFHIDLKKLGHNFSLIRDLYPNKSTLFMVKANAYGHGVLPIVRYCVQELNITEFGCASLAEAVYLRRELDTLEFDIFVFSDVRLGLEDGFSYYLDHRIIPVLSSLDELSIVLENRDFRFLPICLKFNTGMNRLGINIDDLDLVVEKLKRSSRFEIHHLITHIANGSMSLETNKRNIVQQENFKKVKSFLIDEKINILSSSMANSGLIEQGGGVEETHIRPGIIMYGPSCLLPQYQNKSLWKGQIISKLETYIVHTFEIKRGTPVGYGSSPCPKDGIVAIIAIGYGDGFMTKYEGASLYHKGHEGLIIGRVNMDMTYVLFPLEARKDLVDQDRFFIWGEEEKSFSQLCLKTKSIPHEVFSSLLPRVQRIYS